MVLWRSLKAVLDSAGEPAVEGRKHVPASIGATRHAQAPPEAPTTSFQDLPEDLLEKVFSHLDGGTKKRNHFAAGAVSRTWRALAQKMFFSRPWDASHLICHPNQLFALSPRTPAGSRSGLLKCFVRREPPLPAGSPGRRFVLFLGKDPQQTQRSRFLLCALQRGRHHTALYLNSGCQGEPCAALGSGLLCTRYQLMLAGGLVVLPEAAEGPLQAEEGAGSGTDGRLRSTGPSSASLLSTFSGDGDEEPRAGGAAAAASAPTPSDPGPPPQLLLKLSYTARVTGLMKPRRLEVLLPQTTQLPPGQGLPKVRRVGAPLPLPPPPAVPPAARDGGGGGGSQFGPPGRTLSKLSSVAALECPPIDLPGCGAGASPIGAAAAGNPGGGSKSAPPLAAGAGPEVEGGEGLSPTGSGRVGRALLRLARRAPGVGTLVRPHTDAPEQLPPRPVCLHNKAPHWNTVLKCWCLNFRGRVKLASVKNFQLVRVGDPEHRVVMQFGKVDKDAFVLDFNPTALSAAQAFAIALSTFDGKVLP